jgi:hypothetical protein
MKQLRYNSIGGVHVSHRREVAVLMQAGGAHEFAAHVATFGAPWALIFSDKNAHNKSTGFSGFQDVDQRGRHAFQREVFLSALS